MPSSEGSESKWGDEHAVHSSSIAIGCDRVSLPLTTQTEVPVVSFTIASFPVCPTAMPAVTQIKRCTRVPIGWSASDHEVAGTETAQNHEIHFTLERLVDYSSHSHSRQSA